MRTSHRIVAVAVLGLASVSAWMLACRAEPPRPRNVLLLVIDTLRADRLGCYGYPRPTSPRLDALAASGTLYERNYSQASWTVPSMISMFTGLSVTQEEQAVPSEIPMLAEVLRRAGLETVAFPANAVLGDERGFERGFERWDFAPNVDALELAARFEEWHAARSKDRAWFAWLQFIDPHHPYEPKPDHDRFTGPRPDHAAIEPRWRAAQATLAERSPNVETRALDSAVEHMTSVSNRYDGEVLACDSGVGRILDALSASGELDDTLVIVVSDHGEMLFEQPLQPYFVKARIDKTGGLPEGVADLFGNGHRSWFYEDLWNTPMILAGPGIPAARRVQSLSANLDVFPTILEALDLPREPWLEGESLFGGAQTTREHVLAHAYSTSAIRDRDGHKLITHPRRIFLLEGEGEDPAEYFDLTRDPLEQDGAAERSPAQVARLRALILEWIARSQRDVITTLTDAQRAALKAMGYIDGQ